MTAVVTGAHTFTLQRRADNGFLSGTVAGDITTTLEYPPVR